MRWLSLLLFLVGALALVEPVGAHQGILGSTFIRRNPIVLMATVVDIEKQPMPPRREQGSDWVTHCTECRARLRVDAILRDESGLIGVGDSLVVRYTCRCQSRNRLSLPLVTPSGDSLFSEASPEPRGVSLPGSGSFLVGLMGGDDGYAPGKGGFAVLASELPRVLREIEEYLSARSWQFEAF